MTNPARCRSCETGCGANPACVDCGECFRRATSAEREWNLRPFGAGLQRTDDVSGSMVVFVLLLLSTVTFDGFTATPVWAGLERTLYTAFRPLGDARLTVIGTLGLLAFPSMFVLVYGLFAAWMARAAGGELSVGTVAQLFVLSLVPIAIAYHLAHYLTYLLIQGQLVIRLASDPFGFGWDLFGTVRDRPTSKSSAPASPGTRRLAPSCSGISSRCTSLTSSRSARRHSARGPPEPGPDAGTDGRLYDGEPLDHRPTNRRDDAPLRLGRPRVMGAAPTPIGLRPSAPADAMAR